MTKHNYVCLKCRLAYRIYYYLISACRKCKGPLIFVAKTPTKDDDKAWEKLEADEASRQKLIAELRAKQNDAAYFVIGPVNYAKKVKRCKCGRRSRRCQRCKADQVFAALTTEER